MRHVVLAALAASALVCSSSALAQDLSPRGIQYMVPDVTGPATTINAQCTTPTAGCSSGQFASIKLGGRNSVVVTFVGSVFTGTIAPYLSFDGGATWVASSMKSNPAALVNSYSSSFNLAASSATSQYAIAVPYGGATDVMVASTAAVTNTATLQLAATNTFLAAGPTLQAKGTQSGLAQSTQDLKDAGRTFVVLGADGVTPAIAETVITFSQNKAGTVTGSATTYAITSAKTLRLQSLACSFTAGATANRVRVAVRLNTGGACVAGSGLLMPAMELAPNYGTATAAEGGAFGEIAFPDGLELTGASWQICLTESATAAAGTLTCTLTGYEY